MARKDFNPKPGRFGAAPAIIGRLVSTLTGTATTPMAAGTYPGHSAWIEGAAVANTTAATSAGAVTATLQIRRAAGTSVVLTSALDLKTVPARGASQFAFLSTLTDQQRTMQSGDILEIVTVAAGAITAQPVDLVVSAEVLALT